MIGIVKKLIALFATLLVLFIGIFVWFVIGIHSPYKTIETSLAFWMEHDWGSGEKTEADWAELRERIETHNIQTLYFHVGPIDPAGQFAQDLVLPLPELSTLNLAWIGQLRGEIELHNPEVRASIIQSSKWLVDHGFDGIHLNIEPVARDDESFVELAQELRAALPDAYLSIAMDEWQPHSLSRLASKLLEERIESYWSTEQVKTIAPSVDELVVMTYDTKFGDPKLYEWWVEQQTLALSQRMPEGTTLRVGIPSYEEGLGINPFAENIKTGVTGYLKGVKNLRTKAKNIQGLAIYSYWEMSAEEWKTLESL